MMLQPTARFLAKRLCWYAFSPQGRKWFHRRKKMLEIHGNPGVLLIDVVSCWLMLLDVDCWWEIGHPAKWQKQKARMKGHTHTPKETSNAHQQSTRQPSIIPTNRFNPPLCPTLSHASPGAMSSVMEFKVVKPQWGNAWMKPEPEQWAGSLVIAMLGACFMGKSFMSGGCSACSF
jgi:hypothetical protein